MPEEGIGLKNIKLTLAYDGTHYHGFQLQHNAVTVQEKLDNALATVLGQPVSLIAAGRTDAGVHAKGQVVNFTAETRIPVERLPYAVNAILPEDIVVYAAETVPDTFHARYSTKSKVYMYTIDCAPHPRVFTRHYAYHVRYPLDANLIRQAAQSLVGEYDFSSFMASGSAVKTTVRHLMRLDVAENDHYLTITAEANGFLYNMVRIITGTLIEVGRGKRDADLRSVLAASDRSRAGWTAPSHGLVMLEVKY